MLLRKVVLQNFRNLQRGNYDFSPFLTVIIGENARGKTNLLESIYFIANGEGFRETKEEELIEMESPNANVQATFVSDKDEFVYRISLSRKEIGVEKIFFLNKTRQKTRQYVSEQTPAILFSPEQIKIINDAPDIRRDYFNRLLSGYDWEYKKRLANYESALRRRNKILESHFDTGKLIEELVFWNDYLIQQGSYLTDKRKEYMAYLNSNPDLIDKKLRIEYRANELSNERFTDVFEQERRIRRTMIGPHKDDFQIYLLNRHEKNVHRFGSRSEQRLAVLWLKINEVKYFESKLGKKPILLLDDIFSELDSHNKKLALELVEKYQTVATTTEEEVFSLINVPQVRIDL